jgi:hypothetical protein
MNIPTPREIRQRCLEEQRSWTQAERLRRDVGKADQWRATAVPALVITSALNYEAGCNESQEPTPPSATSSVSMAHQSEQAGPATPATSTSSGLPQAIRRYFTTPSGRRSTRSQGSEQR